MNFQILLENTGKKPWPWSWFLYRDGNPIHVNNGVARSEKVARRNAERAADNWARIQYDYTSER